MYIDYMPLFELTCVYVLILLRSSILGVIYKSIGESWILIMKGLLIKWKATTTWDRGPDATS